MLSSHPTILLASEHTKFDAGAERVAIALAEHRRVPLHGIRVIVTNPEFEITAPQLVERAESEAARAAAGLSAAVAAAGVEPIVRIRRGSEPWQEIVDEARDRLAEVLIIRRRGKGAVFARLLVGDMVQKVIAHSPCDVLVVPRSAQFWKRCVLAAIDDSPVADRVAAAAIARAAEAKLPLLVVQVAAGGQEGIAAAQAAIAAAVERARHAGVEAEGRLLSGKVFSAILAAGHDAGADLLVVGWNGQHAVRYAVLGGTAHKLIGLAECPVLVVKG